MKHLAFAEVNEFGFWVGCVQKPGERIARLTNAKHTEIEAVEIAQRMAAYADERDEQEQRNAEYRKNFR